MEDKLQGVRQPIVTATGIILGFVLNFASAWVKSDTHLSEFWAYVVGLCVLLGIVCMLLVLYRILDISYPREHATTYYQTTLKLFITGLSLAFLGALIDMFSNFMAA